MWVNRHSLNNSLVVFLHGLFGSRWATWKGVPRLLQRSFRKDEFLRSYDFYLFEYPTRFGKRQPPIRPYVVEQLTRFLDRRRADYTTIVLIGHSQGGILAKLYVLDRLEAGKGEELGVDLIITLGTPHHGRRLLNPLHLANRVVRVMPRQLCDLASMSDSIRHVCANWSADRITAAGSGATPNSRPIRSIAGVGAYDRFVGERSAAGLGPDEVAHLVGDHSGLVKPRDPSHDFAELLMRELRNHMRPDTVLDEIRATLADSTRLKAFMRQYATAASEEIATARPTDRVEFVEDRAGALLSGFLFDYPRRPLRGLDMGQAVREYVTRRVGPQV